MVFVPHPLAECEIISFIEHLLQKDFAHSRGFQIARVLQNSGQD